MRLELSRAAEADPAGIRDYTAEHHGGMKYPGIEPAIRSVPCRSHRIYYDMADDAVRIQRVLHKAMDAEKWLGN